MREITHAFVLVQQTHDYPFTVAGRYGRHPHIDLLAANANRDSTILGESFFSDIKLRHHFNSRHQQRRKGTAGTHYFPQDSVNPEADHQPCFIGFNMNI